MRAVSLHDKNLARNEFFRCQLLGNTQLFSGNRLDLKVGSP
jgi:hypothetical protein